VLVVGLNGLGIEVSKNLLLAGVHSVTLQETQKTTWHDLSSQFYLTEKDVGKVR
jgi:ubiquitin-activating enzyme E1